MDRSEIDVYDGSCFQYNNLISEEPTNLHVLSHICKLLLDRKCCARRVHDNTLQTSISTLIGTFIYSLDLVCVCAHFAIP